MIAVAVWITVGLVWAAAATPAKGQAAQAARKEPTSTSMQNGETETDAVARQFLTGGPRHPGDVREATSVYPWLTTGRVYFVSDWNLNRVFVVATSGGGAPFVRLTGNTAGLSEFLSKQFAGRSSGVVPLSDVGRLLKDAEIGPLAAIATPELLKRESSGLEEWMQGREKDPDAFARFCTGIHERREKNEWHLQFNVFNTKGGVDSLRASGTLSPLRVREVKVDVVKPAGEFSFPLEG